MSFFKKLKKVAKTAAKAYVTYQTGGLSAVAERALSKKGKARGLPVPMMQSMTQSGGITALPASFVGLGAPVLTQLPRIAGPAIRYGKKALGALGLGGAAEVGAGLVRGIGGTTRRKYRRINPCNIKALRRSIRRIHGAEKVFRQVLSVQGKKSAGIKPKHRKR